MNAERRRSTYLVACGAFLFAAIAGLTACNATPAAQSRAKRTLVVAMPEGVPGGDSGLTQFAKNLVLEGLTQIAGDGRVVPWLAESWQWENDGLTLRVTLPANTTFHDGSRLDAPVAAQILSRIVSTGNPARYPSLAYVRSVEPSGNRDILLKLSERSAFLPEDLEIALDIGSRDSPSGTGAFRITSNTKEEIVLDRFEQYRGGRPAIERVIVKPSATLRNAWTSLLRGEADMVTDVPPDAVEFIGNDEVQVLSFARRYQYLIAFNEARPPFAAPAVRRALNLAIDRAALVRRVLQGQGTPSTGPIWPNYWAYDAAVPAYGYDPQQAEAILDAAGFPRQPAPVRGDKPPARFRFRCLIPANFSVWEHVALEVQKSLYAIGVDMEFDAVPFEQFDTAIRDGRFDAAIIDMISGPTPGRAFIFWRSSRHLRGLNVFGYDNDEVETLFNALRISSNEAAVRSATRRLQRVFLEDPPALFLAWNQRARAIRRDFAVPSEAGRDPLQTLWRWTPGPAPRLASNR